MLRVHTVQTKILLGNSTYFIYCYTLGLWYGKRWYIIIITLAAIFFTVCYILIIFCYILSTYCYILSTFSYIFWYVLSYFISFWVHLLHFGFSHIVGADCHHLPLGFLPSRTSSILLTWGHLQRVAANDEKEIVDTSFIVRATSITRGAMYSEIIWIGSLLLGKKGGTYWPVKPGLVHTNPNSTNYINPQ